MASSEPLGRLSAFNVLVTGASGFVGSHLIRELYAQGAVVRTLSGRSLVRRDATPVIGPSNVIVHLAARVHVMNDDAADPLEEFRRANVEATRKLLDECAGAAAPPHFIYISSVKAVAEEGLGIDEDTPPAPADPYGVSKLEAERLVTEYAGRGHVHATILRLPLVYGPGMKGNMLRLFRAVARGVPMPFGSVRNQRSVLFVQNLVEAIVRSIETVAPCSRVFFIADRPPLSSAELVRTIAAAMSRRPRLLPIPEAFLALMAPAIGRAALARITGSLTVRTDRFIAATGYQQPYSIEEGIRITADGLAKRAGSGP